MNVFAHFKVLYTANITFEEKPQVGFSHSEPLQMSIYESVLVNMSKLFHALDALRSHFEGDEEESKHIANEKMGWMTENRDDGKVNRLLSPILS